MTAIPALLTKLHPTWQALTVISGAAAVGIVLGMTLMGFAPLPARMDAVELQVESSIDNPHPTAADFLEDFVVGECLAYHGDDSPCVSEVCRFEWHRLGRRVRGGSRRKCCQQMLGMEVADGHQCSSSPW